MRNVFIIELTHNRRQSRCFSFVNFRPYNIFFSFRSKVIPIKQSNNQKSKKLAFQRHFLLQGHFLWWRSSGLRSCAVSWYVYLHQSTSSLSTFDWLTDCLLTISLLCLKIPLAKSSSHQKSFLLHTRLSNSPKSWPHWGEQTILSFSKNQKLLSPLVFFSANFVTPFFKAPFIAATKLHKYTSFFSKTFLKHPIYIYICLQYAQYYIYKIRVGLHI